MGRTARRPDRKARRNMMGKAREELGVVVTAYGIAEVRQQFEQLTRSAKATAAEIGRTTMAAQGIDAGSSGPGGFRGLLKELNAEFGKRSLLAQTLKLGAGGGAIAGLSMAAGELHEFVKSLRELSEAAREGTMSWAELVDKIAAGVPIFGKIYQTGREIREMFSGENAQVKAIMDDAKRGEAHAKMIEENRKAAGDRIAQANEHAEALGDEAELYGINGPLTGPALQRAQAELKRRKRAEDTGKYYSKLEADARARYTKELTDLRTEQRKIKIPELGEKFIASGDQVIALDKPENWKEVEDAKKKFEEFEKYIKQIEKQRDQEIRDLNIAKAQAAKHVQGMNEKELVAEATRDQKARAKLWEKIAGYPGEGMRWLAGAATQGASALGELGTRNATQAERLRTLELEGMRMSGTPGAEKQAAIEEMKKKAAELAEIIGNTTLPDAMRQRAIAARSALPEQYAGLIQRMGGGGGPPSLAPFVDVGPGNGGAAAQAYREEFRSRERDELVDALKKEVEESKQGRQSLNNLVSAVKELISKAADMLGGGFCTLE